MTIRTTCRRSPAIACVAMLAVLTAAAASVADTITGTPGDDVLTGTGGRDRIDGRGGDDTIRGLARNDLVFGSSGNDSLFGGAGHDRLVGGVGADTVSGGLCRKHRSYLTPQPACTAETAKTQCRHRTKAQSSCSFAT